MILEHNTMLCSMSTGKSGSNWLDRLRSSKGFPAADQLNLEQFLTHHTPNHSNSSDSNVPHSTANQIDPNSSSNPAQPGRLFVPDGNQAAETNGGAGEREWFGVMSNVLSELFYMGDPKSFSKKKSCRKQRNPKICHLSASKISDDTCTVSGNLQSSLHSSRPKKKISSQLKLKEQEGVDLSPIDGEEEEEKGNADLSAFSRTEVTVIDTSFPSWKFDKLLFRRKNVWKVRDRKCKAIVASKRKRKASLENDNGYVGEEKKQCSSSKDMDHEVGLVPSHGRNGQMNKIGVSKQSQTNKIGASKHTYDAHCQFPENRQVGQQETVWWFLMILPSSRNDRPTSFIVDKKDPQETERRQFICHLNKKHSYK